MIECNVEAVLTLNTLDEVAGVEDLVSSWYCRYATYEKQKTLDNKIILTIKLNNYTFNIYDKYYMNQFARIIHYTFEGKEKPKITICVKPLVHETWYTF